MAGDEGGAELPQTPAQKTYPRPLGFPHTPPHDPAHMDASATNVWAGSVRVPHGSPWGRPKADRWPDVDKRCERTTNPITPTSHRGNPEGQRGDGREVGRKSGSHFFGST